MPPSYRLSLLPRRPPARRLGERRQRAVVAEEEDDRRPVRLPPAQGVEQPPELPVHLRHHPAQACRRVALALRPAPLADLLVVGRRHPRGVGVVQPEVDEAGRVPVRPEELQGPIDHPPGAVPPLHRVVRRPDPVPRGDVRVGLGALPGAGPEVIPVRGELRRIPDVPAAAEVPLADVGGGVPGRLQHPGERGGLGGEEVGLLARPVPGPRLEVAGDPPAGRELAGDDPAPRRRADRGGDIEPGEPDALLRHPVEVRDLGGHAAGTAQVAPAEVVGEDEDHVRPRGLGGRPGPPEPRDEYDRREGDAERVVHRVDPRPRDVSVAPRFPVGCHRSGYRLRGPGNTRNRSLTDAPPGAMIHISRPRRPQDTRQDHHEHPPPAALADAPRPVRPGPRRRGPQAQRPRLPLRRRRLRRVRLPGEQGHPHAEHRLDRQERGPLHPGLRQRPVLQPDAGGPA